MIPVSPEKIPQLIGRRMKFRCDAAGGNACRLQIDSFA